MWNRNPKRSPTLYVFFFFFKSSLFSYVEAKFNKDEYFKSTVALLVKLLNHSLLPAFHCQQSKADNHSFSQGVKSLRWHWSLEKSTHGTHTEYNKSVRCEWKPPSSFCTYTTKSATERRGKVCGREMYFTHIDYPLFMGTPSVNTNTVVTRLCHTIPSAASAGTYRRLFAPWDLRQQTQHSPGHSELSTPADQYEKHT